MERGLGDGLCFVSQANCESCQDQTDQRPEQPEALGVEHDQKISFYYMWHQHPNSSSVLDFSMAQLGSFLFHWNGKVTKCYQNRTLPIYKARDSENIYPKDHPIFNTATFCPPSFTFKIKGKPQQKKLTTHNLYGLFLSKTLFIFVFFVFCLFVFFVSFQKSPKDTMLGTSRRSYKWRSQALSDEIRDSGGAQRAVELIQELMPRSKRATLQSKYGIWDKKKDVFFCGFFWVNISEKKGGLVVLIRKHIWLIQFLLEMGCIILLKWDRFCEV